MISTGSKRDAAGRMPPAIRETSAPPEFGRAAFSADEPPGPRELFCRLAYAPEDHVNAVEPAFGVVTALLAAAGAGPAERDPESFVSALIASAAQATSLSGLRYAPSWPLRVAREYAPLGLTDGVWLQGAARVNTAEDAVGMLLLRQLMIRFGGPGTSESYAQRYASLLRSIGVVPESITRWHRPDDAPCVELSFERALLGVALALFPRLLRAETLGFELWMAHLGPCPLLAHLAEPLRERGAQLAYLDDRDRANLERHATAAVVRYLQDDNTAPRRDRVWRGFAAAQRAYDRWAQAMRGRNIPMTSHQAVLDILRRKAQFAIGHHDGVRVGGRDLDSYLAMGPSGHVQLMAAFAASPWITPGKPEASSFVQRSISFDGPMFDAFTPDEQADLCDWIAGLAAPPASEPALPPIELAGVYGPVRDPDSLEQDARARYGTLELAALAHCLVNSDEHPTVRVVARAVAQTALDRLSHLLDTDTRLESVRHPKFSARALEAMLADCHARNVGDRLDSQRNGTEASHPAWRDLQDVLAARKPPSVLAILDGYWLSGATDVTRIDREEYGWLFRINMSELGDGALDRNHNVIARNFLDHLGDHMWLPPSDPAMYAAFEIPIAFVTNMAMVLNTERFLPELLGLNLAIEAASVGGMFKTAWKQSARRGAAWAALYFRLHNSIDNYASGHTRWSIAAIHAYLSRVAAVAPAAVDEHWRRSWRIWRAHELLVYGTPAQRELLRSVETFATTPERQS